jgi:hypothetical protein
LAKTPEFSLTLQIKLASLIVHHEERSSPGRHRVDTYAVNSLRNDPRGCRIHGSHEVVRLPAGQAEWRMTDFQRMKETLNRARLKLIEEQRKLSMSTMTLNAHDAFACLAAAMNEVEDLK